LVRKSARYWRSENRIRCFVPWPGACLASASYGLPVETVLESFLSISRSSLRCRGAPRSGSNPRFLLKTMEALRIACKRFRKNLDGHLALEPRIAPDIPLPCPLHQELLDLIRPEFRSKGELHSWAGIIACYCRTLQSRRLSAMTRTIMGQNNFPVSPQGIPSRRSATELSPSCGSSTPENRRRVRANTIVFTQFSTKGHVVGKIGDVAIPAP
jgi:hypothetical protein